MTSTVTRKMTCAYDLKDYTLRYEFPDGMDKASASLLIKDDEIGLRKAVDLSWYEVNFVTDDVAYIKFTTKAKNLVDVKLSEYAVIRSVELVLSLEKLNKAILARVKSYEEEASHFARLYYNTEAVETTLISYQVQPDSLLSETLSYEEFTQRTRLPVYKANLTMTVESKVVA